MIMGVDERDDDVGRSDTLMVATLDPKKDHAALMSIPRDTRVKIKGHGWDKINAAYAYGSAKGGPEAGEKLTQRTVEDFLGVNMDHYVVINIQAFQKIIDAIGGIDIDVEKRMYYEDPWDDDGGLIIDLQPGMQHMDGKTAVTYVRYRDEEGDIGRIKRQQKFMKACMDKSHPRPSSRNCQTSSARSCPPSRPTSPSASCSSSPARSRKPRRMASRRRWYRASRSTSTASAIGYRTCTSCARRSPRRLASR